MALSRLCCRSPGVESGHWPDSELASFVLKNHDAAWICFRAIPHCRITHSAKIENRQMDFFPLPWWLRQIELQLFYYYTFFCKIIEIIAKQSQHYFPLFYYYLTIVFYNLIIIFLYISYILFFPDYYFNINFYFISYYCKYNML